MQPLAKPGRNNVKATSVANKKAIKQANIANSDSARAVPKASAATAPDFPIVGIGASAGGLEAFENFFAHVAPDCGMAFVLVPHLDPSHASILVEILQRITALKVSEADNQMLVQANHVYIIPPNRDMAIKAGKLQLSKPEQTRGQRMPIDHFFRSLADERADKAIGIVLSGTGSDGTLGLRAIQGAGGLCLAQEPDTAKYDGMPQSAIQAGHVTNILPVEDMPKVLLDSMKHFVVSPVVLPPPTANAGHGLDEILLLLQGRTGNDFSQYKKNTVARRVERRMMQQRIDDIEVYCRYLKDHPAEVKRLFQELLINVTSFFRDPEAFAVLKQEIFSKLLSGKPDGYIFRVWVVGCATGEEAYSIAILFSELMEENRLRFKVQIYATDLDEDAISTARIGRYLPNIAQDVSAARLNAYFLLDETGYRVKKEIREMVIFAVHSVIKDPPFTRLDLLSCRNLLIYLEAELQSRLILNFHYALKPNGFLFLSASESIIGNVDLFPPLNRQWKIFRAASTSIPSRNLMTANAPNWPAAVSEKTGETQTVAKTRAFSMADITHRVLLQSYAPASVLTDAQGNILYVYGDTGRYLRPPPGEATLSVVDMAIDPLQPVLRMAIFNAIGGEMSPQSRDVSVKTDDGLSMVRFSLRKLPGANAGECLLLMSFQEIPQPVMPAGKNRDATPDERLHEQQRNEELERELAYHRKTLQATVEAQQLTNEELKSTNEELQSTNEELETSREELSSLNEELMTVNAELHAKIEQLNGMQNDMKNLLDNVNVGTIFLDQRLNVRRFTRDATRVFRLLPADVGRPLADIKSGLKGEDLLIQAKKVLDTLLPYENEVQTEDGISYLVVIQPYRTLDNVIDGVVMTFTDISARVALEVETQLVHEMAEGIVNTVREPLVVLDGSLKVVFASRSFYRDFLVTPEETLGQKLYDLGNRQWDIPNLRKLLENILPKNSSFDDYLVEHDFPEIGRQRMLLNARSIPAKGGKPKYILLAIERLDGKSSGT